MAVSVRVILAGACASAIGVVLAASGSGAGGYVTMVGWLALAVGIHGFGRAG